MKNVNKNEENRNANGKVKALLSKSRARMLTAMMCLASLLSVSAFAADGETTATTGMDAVLDSFDTLGSLMSKVWTLMTSNPLLTLVLAVAVLGIGITVFRRIKSAARS